MSSRKSGRPFQVAPEAARRNLLRISIASAIAAIGTLVVAPQVDARITKIQITTKESPTFGGYSFPGVGQYEKIVGTAFGEVDPSDPKNAGIVDLQLAPRNAAGHVEYSHDFYILKPIDLTKGNQKVMYEPPNRGRKTWQALGRVTSGGNDPGSITGAAELANSFLMPRGYTMVWSGWDFSAGKDNTGFVTTMTFPIAKNLDGSTITGPAFEYIVSPGASYALNYPASTLDQSKATLTHRVHLDDVPQVVPAAGWAYNSTGTSISLVGSSFVANDIYEFSYTAKDPTVNGLGFAAIRDFNAFLRYETKDDAGTPNPLAGYIKRIYTETSSQPARTLNDFTSFGFNQAENGKLVFDGMMQWIGAGSGIGMNFRFSQPGRTERNRQDHLFGENVFPFANVITTDPISGKTDSRYNKCTATNTCPFAMEIFSANEYWVKSASLMTTTPDGTKDLDDAGGPFTRIYFVSSHQHGVGSATSKGACQQFQNPLDSQPIQRSLFLAMDDWVTKGTPPPASQYPKFADGTLVPPLPQSGLGFPSIPGVTFTGLKTTRYRFNRGPNFYETGIATITPPVITPPYEDNPANGPIYPSFVPKTDADGLDIAGIRLPDVTVPLATYTGWALRAAPQNNDGCESSGQFIPFANTKAQRTASGDPRLSIEERYPTFSAYYYAVTGAVNNFVANRWMLPEDAPAAVNRMLTAGINTGAIKLDHLYKELREKGLVTAPGEAPAGSSGVDNGANALDSMLLHSMD